MTGPRNPYPSLIQVLIVDFDIHPGNGTFYSVKGDDRILFASLHLYHYGAFWPFTTDMDYETPGNSYINPIEYGTS